MKKEQARALWQHAHKVAANFSRQDREFNYNNETFSVHSVEVLSDSTAAVYFKKEPTKKMAVIFCYWTNGGGGRWNYFFPTDSHVVGMTNFKDKLIAVERHNYPLNFEQPDNEGL